MVRRERIVNYSATTLNGAINDTVTSIPVTTGTQYPLEGDYRMRIDSEVVLVTANAANVLTVVRGVDGTTGVSHADGADIEPILTATGLTTLVEDILCYPSERNAARLEDSTGAILTASDFTFDNQATATLVDNTDGTLTLRSLETDTSGTRVHVIYKTAPAAPYTLTLCIQLGTAINDVGSDSTTIGAAFRENSTGEFITNTIAQLGQGGVFRWNSPTSFASTLVSPTRFNMQNVIWWQLEDDNVDLFWRMSSDGVKWHQTATEGRTAFMAGGPDEIAVTMAERGTSDPHDLVIKSWLEE